MPKNYLNPKTQPYSHNNKSHKLDAAFKWSLKGTMILHPHNILEVTHNQNLPKSSLQSVKKVSLNKNQQKSKEEYLQ